MICRELDMEITPVIVSILCSAIIAFIGWHILFKNAKKLASRSETYTIRHLNSEDGAKAIFPVRSACTLESTKALKITDDQERAKILRSIYGVISSCEAEVYKAFEKKYPPLN